MRIIGIDPGTIVTGYGIVDRKRSAVSFVACGCIVNRPHVPLPVRFLKIHRELGEVLDAYRPAEMAVEGIFFCRNVKTSPPSPHPRSRDRPGSSPIATSAVVRFTLPDHTRSSPA